MSNGVRYNHHRTRCILEGINAVADSKNVNWDVMSPEDQYSFLQENWEEIIKSTVSLHGKEFEQMKNFRAAVVTNEGSAVLYFERI